MRISDWSSDVCSSDLLAALNNDVAPILNGLQFVSEGAEPVLGPPEAGSLEGPWFGTAIRNQYNGLSGTLDLVIDKRLMAFYADGRFFRGIPPSEIGRAACRERVWYV